MGFLFGLFRFLTWGNAFIQGFFMLLMLIFMMINPAAALFSMMIFGFVLFHNILCLQLQKALKEPAVNLSPSFPTILTVVSVLTFIYSMLTFKSVIDLAGTPVEEFRKAVMANAKSDPQITPAMIDAMRNFLLFILVAYGLAIATNCVLSSVFLNKWKKARQQQEEEEETFLDV